MRPILRYSARFSLFVIWVLASIYLGGIVVSVKETLGINVFSTTGYSALKRCLVQETNKAVEEKTHSDMAN